MKRLLAIVGLALALTTITPALCGFTCDASCQEDAAKAEREVGSLGIRGRDLRISPTQIASKRRFSIFEALGNTRPIEARPCRDRPSPRRGLRRGP
jgi:hypothetical protein